MNPTDPQFSVPKVNAIIPAAIVTKDDLQIAADTFAEAEAVLRSIESQRKEFTSPMNTALRKWNATAKSAAAPITALQEAIRPLLAEWRKRPETQEQKARLLHLQRKGHEAMRDGDVEGVELVASQIAEISDDITLTTTHGNVQFRRNLSLVNIDETKLPERYFKRVVDEDAIKSDIKLMGSVPGVEHEWTFNPYLRES